MSLKSSLALFVLSWFGCVSAGAVGPDERLALKRPDDGRFVKTDQGYMVPYLQPIPGSNAVIEMVPCPAGKITLFPLPKPVFDDGTVDKNAELLALTNQQPIEISFAAFWIGKFEITMKQFMPYRRLYYQHKKDRRAGTNTSNDPTAVDAVTGPTEVYDPLYNFEYAGSDDSPVPTVSQFASRQYTKYISLLTGTEYRLPLRSEWQHACLAGSSGDYCFGNDTERLIQYADYGQGIQADYSDKILVGRKKPNDWGLFDVHGNLSEFVIEDSASTGLEYGHVACGGNFESDAANCKATSVIRTTIDWWDQDPDFPQSSWWMTSESARATGFRILSPLEPMTAKQRKTYWDADSEELTENVASRLKWGRGSVGTVTRYRPSTHSVD